MTTLRKTTPTSFILSPTCRSILLTGKRIDGKTYTAILEEALIEWSEKHLRPEDYVRYEATNKGETYATP